jgi:tRNA (uracil-5-)-methyltransferase TRM9
MQEKVLRKLLSINREFYQDFASSFSQTRQRIQPGVLMVLNDLPREGNWLDIGCGNGRLALEWDRQRRTGTYVGLDFSKQLLEHAKKELELLRMSPTLQINFFQADLTTPEWGERLPEYQWTGILAFAVLHHIPSKEMRLNLLKNVNQLLDEKSKFIFSVWQFQHSQKLLDRQVAWEQVGLSATEVDPGDTLMDWRSDIKDDASRIGVRYVHLFARQELEELAAAAGFQILDQFDADGFNGKLGHYEIWQKTINR